MEIIIEKLKTGYNIADVVKRNDNFLIFTIEKEMLVTVLNYLKNVEGFKTLVQISCVDWLEDNKFQLTYNLWNQDEKWQVLIRIFLDREKPDFTSIGDMWVQAYYFEREIKEMFGVSFEGNPIQDEEFILEDWDDIPPMRRDFDTEKYVQDTYFERPGREHIEVKNYIDSMFNREK